MDGRSYTMIAHFVLIRQKKKHGSQRGTYTRILTLDPKGNMLMITILSTGTSLVNMVNNCGTRLTFDSVSAAFV